MLVANWTIQNDELWHMGTHLRLISRSFLMNIYMTGFRWFSKIFTFLCLRCNKPLHLKGLIYIWRISEDRLFIKQKWPKVKYFSKYGIVTRCNWRLFLLNSICFQPDLPVPNCSVKSTSQTTTTIYDLTNICKLKPFNPFIPVSAKTATSQVDLQVWKG